MILKVNSMMARLQEKKTARHSHVRARVLLHCAMVERNLTWSYIKLCNDVISNNHPLSLWKIRYFILKGYLRYSKRSTHGHLPSWVICSVESRKCLFPTQLLTQLVQDSSMFFHNFIKFTLPPFSIMKFLTGLVNKVASYLCLIRPRGCLSQP